MNEDSGALESTHDAPGRSKLGWLGLGLGVGLLGLAYQRASRRARARARRRRRLPIAVGVVAGLAIVKAIASARSRRAAARGSKGPLAAAITIARPPAEIYGFWRGSQNWHRFFSDLQRVESRGDGRFLIEVRGPLQKRFSWQLQATEDHPNQSLTWEATTENGRRLYTASVRFADAPGGRGTEVTYGVEWPPSGGLLGVLAANLLRFWAPVRLANDLRRLKQVLETGHVARSDASIHAGPHAARPAATPSAAAVPSVSGSDVRRELARAKRTQAGGAAPGGGR